MSRIERGFTLVELMVVVAIVGILSAIAIPAYSEYVMKGRRTDGRSALLDTAGRLERYYSENARYTTAVGTGVCAGVVPAESPDKYYALTSTAPVCTDSTFLLTAAPQGVQATDKCGSLTLTHAQVKGFSGTASSCW